MSIPAFSARLAPFSDVNSFQLGMEYLDLSDILQAIQVSRAWKHEADKPLVWQQLSQREGVPLVQSESMALRNRKEDFKALQSITISGRIIGQYLGTVVGPIPPIPEKLFLQVMNELDPLEDITVLGIAVTSRIGRFFGWLLGGGVPMKKNYRFMVIPSFVQRILPANLVLDEVGNLVARPNNPVQNGGELAEERLVKIPFTFHNIKQLSLHPLRIDNDNYSDLVWSEEDNILQQCDSCASRNSVYLLRDPVVPKSQLLSALAQESLVNAAGFEVTSLRVSTLYNLMNILRGNWKPSDRSVFVRFSDRVPAGFIGQSAIGLGAHLREPRLRLYLHNLIVRDDIAYYVSAGVDATASKHRSS